MHSVCVHLRELGLIELFTGLGRDGQRMEGHEAAEAIARCCEAALRDQSALRELRALVDASPDDEPQTVASELTRQFRGGRIGLLRRAPPSPRIGLELGPLLESTPEIINPFDPPEPSPDVGEFTLRVVDEVGDPIEGVDLRFEILGVRHSATTDGNGEAKVETEDGSSALVDMVAPKRVRDTLAPRWAEPREPAIPEASQDEPVEVEILDDVFDPLRIRRNRPHTLVLTPRFVCRELSATTFEFARSFPRAKAIPRLAAIAEELHQDDQQLAWVFGHTDLSGSELLNKRLSERRARAVFAVFTHDVEAWDEMWLGKAKESPWWERWGTREAQHMLNAVSCRDDDGNPLGEDGAIGSKTRQSVKRFQRGEYPSVPDEQAALKETGAIDTATRRELFFAYAKLITREPVDSARFPDIGDSPFMGCGEFNPLSLAAKDEQSRRTVVFIFDPAAQPADPPCVLGDLEPCRGQQAEPPAPQEPQDDEPEEEPKKDAFFRCSFYKGFGCRCPGAGGPDLAHDVIVRFFMPLAQANELPHRFVLEADDDSDDDDGDDSPMFTMERALKSDARTVVPVEEQEPQDDPDDPDDDDDPDDGDDDDDQDDQDDDDQDDDNQDDDDQDDDDQDEEPPPHMVEIHFEHVPDAAKYRLRVDGIDSPYSVFIQRPFHLISELSAAMDVIRFPRLFDILNPPDPLGIDPKPADPKSGESESQS